MLLIIIIMQKKNQLIQFGDNMYKTFLKQIKANIFKHLNYKSVVGNSEIGTVVEKYGSDIAQKVKSAIASSGKASDSMLKLILSDSIATIQYLGNDPSRHDQVLQEEPNFADAYLSDYNFAFYYLDKVLNSDISKNTDFVTKLKNLLTTKNIDMIPAYIYITGDADQKLINAFVKIYYLSGEDIAKENINLIKDFSIALEQHGKLDEQFKDKNVQDMLEFYLVESKHSLDNTEDSMKNENNKQNNQVSNIFDLNFSAIDNKSFIDFFNELNNLGNSTLTNKDIDSDTSVQNIVNTYLRNVNNMKTLKSLLSDVEMLKFYEQIAKSNNGDKFIQFLNNLLSKVKTANIRGKKMFKLAKAYTRYYIKNMLPSMLKQAGNDPEATSKVIKVSTDEIQDLMYGDTVNHPENLAEVNNPAVRDQISFDVEQAVKGDQIPGGASDGMSIEDIAKKWSEIYKQVPYEHLLEVLKTQEQAGSIVEQEHTDNLEIAKEIARDHLVEAPDYYTHLEDMEQLFPAENVSEKPLPEPEGMDLQTLENPLPKNEDSDHVCDGSCGGNCKCHHDKVQTVEDKVKGLDSDGVMVIMVEETPEVQEEQPLEFIQQIAAKIKR